MLSAAHRLPVNRGRHELSTHHFVHIQDFVSDVRPGIAFDPTTSHLHVLDPENLRLYEVTDTGVVVTNRDVSDFGLNNPQAMVFAPSGDQTDDPSVMSLYIANSRNRQSKTSAGAFTAAAGGITELSVTR